MTVCFECSQDSEKALNCKHVDEPEYCIECYTELHYYLTHVKQDLQSD